MASDRDVKSRPSPRQLALGGALACTLAVAAAYAVGTSESPIASSAVLNTSGAAPVLVRSAGRQSTDTRFMADRNWSEKLRRTPIELEPGGSLMGSKSWTPPPPPPVAKAVPTVPPFPFQYMGKLVLDDGATTVYLTKGDEIYTVRPGEVIAGSYRVDTLGSDFLEVTYLPLDKKQNVTFSSILPPTRADGISMSSRAVAPVTLAQVNAPQAGDGASSSRRAEAGATTATAQTQTGGLAAAPVADATGLPAPAPSGGGAAQNTAAATAASSGGMVIAPPSISQMPMSAPTISQMPILPPPSGSMPMFAPNPGATMPGVTASGGLSTTPAPKQ